MRKLRQHPGAVLDFGGLNLLVGRSHQVCRSIQVSKQLPQIGSAREPRHVARAEIEHPLAGLLRLAVVPQLDIRVYQKPVDQNIIWETPVQRPCELQCLGELMLAEENPDLYLLS